MAEDLIKQNKLSDCLELGSRNLRLRAANGTYMPIIGTIKLWFQGQGYSNPVLIHALVTSAISQQIMISWHDLIRMGVLPKGFPYAQLASRNDVDIHTILAGRCNTIDGQAPIMMAWTVFVRNSMMFLVILYARFTVVWWASPCIFFSVMMLMFDHVEF